MLNTLNKTIPPDRGTVTRQKKINVLLKYGSLLFMLLFSSAFFFESAINGQDEGDGPPSPPPGDMSGGPGGMGGPPPGGGMRSYTLSGVFTLDGGAPKTESGKTYKSSKTDVSAIYVLNNANLSLNNPEIVTTGNTTSNDNSSFYGLNAAVLVSKGGHVTIKGGTIITSGSGANGVMAVDPKASVSLSNLKIKATGGGAHGIMATNGGTMELNNVDMDTAGRSGAPIATDRGGGTINVTGGSVISSGGGSPCIYSTGTINARNITGVANNSEAVVIEGKNNVSLTDCKLKGLKLCGVMIYQSFSGDAEIGIAKYSMTGGLLEAKAGPLFYINNTKSEVYLTSVELKADSGTIIKAAAGRWGRAGKNGGKLTFTADKQVLNGNIEADNISSVVLNLKNDSVLTGSLNSANTAGTMTLSMDSSSKWNVTSDSYLGGFNYNGAKTEDAIINVTGNGHTVYYDKNNNSSLGGKTYNLSNGGKLTPK